KMLERERFDIIHHHEPLVPFLSMQVLDSARCPQVATFHAFGGFSVSYWLGKSIGLHYLNKLDARIAVSSAARHFVARYFPVDDRDKARFYKTADIFCAPSTGQESFGIVLLEAMAAGLPVVASDIHGYKRVVQRNVTGLLVEPKEPDAIAAALERLICDEGLRRRLGEAGARRAPEYDWSHVTRELLDLYGEVIAKRVAA